MDAAQIKHLTQTTWDDSILPALEDFVRIPNKSPLFDPQWDEHGHMERAVDLAARWCREQQIKGMTVEVMRLAGRTPLLFIEVPGELDECVLLYGHLDKQPEFSGWREDLSPWEPVIEHDKLYGRGGADDGYAVFSSLTALRALQEQNIPHARCVLVIECDEESGSADLPYHIAALEERIGEVSLVVCLDAECGDYNRLWCTTSLRGNLVGTLRVNVLTEGVHSGAASGIVPSSFRVLRSLLARVEHSDDGRIVPEALYADIPEERLSQARQAAQALGNTLYRKFPFVKGMQPLSTDADELVLNNTWRPALEITGAEGFPAIGSAGNVMRPESALKLSFRLAPTTDAAAAGQAVKQLLEKNPPYNAKVEFDLQSTMGGWNAPKIEDWLVHSMKHASNDFFGTEAMYMGTGGSIPFMSMLGKKFPRAQFLVTGLLGPRSNAHGPNEFLHIPTAKKLTACVARVVADHYHASRDG